MHAFISFQINSNIAAKLKELSCQANLKNASERLIKSIVDLRKKIYIVQEKLENESKVSSIQFFLDIFTILFLQRKREMEKKMSEVRNYKKNITAIHQT